MHEIRFEAFDNHPQRAMPGGEDKVPGPVQQSSVNIPVASVSPRRTPTRCAASRGVVGVGVAHLSDATRERLAAASQQQLQQQQQQQQVYSDSGNMSQQILRQRRMSGREQQPVYSQSTFGTVTMDYSSLGKCTSNDTRCSMANYGNISCYNNAPTGSSSSSSSSSTSMRYANSLDSLDAVTNSIQQARANSFNNTNVSSFYQTIQPSGAIQQIYQSNTMSPRREDSESRSQTYRDPATSTPSRNFQRTFPLRKTSTPSAKNQNPPSGTNTGHQTHDASDGEATIKREKESNRGWRQSADELTDASSSMSASFWLSPCRVPTRPQNVNNYSHGVYSSGFAENDTRNTSKFSSSDVIATVSPFRTPRPVPVITPDTETQRLRRELQLEQERVQRLSAQLSTNSHVVSAFEHSLANMTDRLAKLTSTSEKKDKELSDLKLMIDHLKESSDLKGFPAPVRWRSDENVLSGSSKSKNKNFNGSESDNEGNKRDSSGSLRTWRPKKQTWFRSSLSKAFSRHKPNSHSNTNGATLPKENGSKTPKKEEYSNSISHQRSVSVSALDDPFVLDLQRQLAVKDDLLTETRLEALSSASQLQVLRETVAKLRSELKSIQRENEDLKHKMRSSNGNLSNLDHSVAIDDDKVPSSLFANMSMDRGSCGGLRIDVPVIVRVEAPDQTFLTKIGYIRMSRRQDWNDLKKWRELDMNVQCVFGLYMARLDPFDRLGLSAEASIERYHFLGRSRQPINIENSEFQLGQITESFDTPNLKSRKIYITLRARRCSDIIRPTLILDEIVFTTLRPKTLLQMFCESLIKTRLGFLLGPKGSGKRFTSHRLAELLTKENSVESSHDIHRITFNNFEKDEQRLNVLDEFERKINGLRGNARVLVIIFENIDSGDEASFQRLFFPRVRTFLDSNHFPLKIYVLLTSSNRCDVLQDIPMALLSTSQTDCRIEKSFLGYFLRRKVIDVEAESQEANDAMIVAVNWLNRLAIHFEEFCQRVDPLAHFSSTPFITPDLDNTHKFRTWFLDLWNMTIVLNLREIIHGAQSRGILLNDLEDPVRFVFRTWPWREDVAGLPQALRPVLSNSTQNRTRLKSEDFSAKNEDPLLDMLLCLQEATKESPKEDLNKTT